MNKTTLYNFRWDKARRAFLAKNPICVMCKDCGFIIPANVVDHIIPHRLRFAKTPSEYDAALKLFWDESNWQPLCNKHHDSTKRRMERSGKGYGCNEMGMPGDPSSHWY